MTDFNEIFADQLKTVKVNDGDFLNGRTIEAVVDEYKKRDRALYDQHGKESTMTDEDYIDMVERKIEESKKYAGSRKVMCLEIVDNKFQQVVPVWESEWETFKSNHEYVDHPTSSMPRFKII